HGERQRRLPEGARHETDLLERGMRQGARYDLAVEATGKGTTLELLVPFVKPRGTLVLKTTCESRAPLNLSLAVVDEITIVGSRCGPFEPALQALEDGAIPVAGLIAQRFELGEAAKAFAAAGKPGTLKVVLSVS